MALTLVCSNGAYVGMNDLKCKAHLETHNGNVDIRAWPFIRPNMSTYSGKLCLSKSIFYINKKNYNMKYHVILGRFKWLINVSPSLEGIRYPRSVYVLSFVCFFLLLLLYLYSLEKQFGWFLTHISRLHI